MFQTGCDSDFIYDRLAKNKIVSVGVDPGGEDGLVLSVSEIPIDDAGLFLVEDKIVKGNKYQQEITGIDSQIFYKKDENLITGSGSSRFTFPFSHEKSRNLGDSVKFLIYNFV